MAEVFGQIGNQPVELNNAATETTLRELLAAVQAAGGIGAATKTVKIAESAISNINAAGESLEEVAEAADDASKATLTFEERLKKANAASDLLRTSFENLEKQFGPFIAKLAQGTANASDLYGSFTHLKGVVGLTAVVFQKVAAFQEENLRTYQQITSAGANFGGSLTEMRMAAQNSYMSLESFTNIIKTNGEAFAKMGGTVDQGARAFVKASNQLLSGEAGDNLRALGYTTEQVNQGMLNYISITGGRNRKEMQDTDALAKSTTLYLQELDQLSAITGKSREEQEQKIKKEMEEADFQLFLATKSKEEREVIEGNVKRAMTLYGQGGADIAKANAMGVAVQGEAGKKLTALSATTSESIKRDLDLRRKYGAQSEQVIQNEINGRQSNARDLGRLAGPVASFGGALKGIEDAGKLAARDRIAGDKEVAEQYKQTAKERQEREESQAKAAGEAQKAIQQMGQALMSILLPAIKILTPIVNALTSVLGFVVKKFGELEAVGTALVAMLIAYLAYQKLRNAKAAADEAKEKTKAILEKAKVEGVTGLGKLGTYSNPMYVIVMGKVPGPGGKGGGAGGKGDKGGGAGGKGGGSGGAGGGAGGAGAGGGAGGAGGGAGGAGAGGGAGGAGGGAGAGKFGKMGALAKGLTGGIGGILGGFALDAASKKLEDEGHTKTAAGLGVASDVATYAGMGATIGSVIPGLGTAVGAGIGALGGGAYSLYKNWGKLTGNEEKEEKPKMAQGGIVTEPTEVLAGEAGPEAIIPLKHFESLRVELEMLNKQSAEMIRYMKETADYAKRNVDATKSLNGDLFKF